MKKRETKKYSRQLKKLWKKFWFIVWKDDSLRGWIISIIFIFLLIKFLFLPGLSLLTGTTLPLAIVESCSMYHDTNALFFHDFDAWWEQHESKYAPLIINDLDFKNYLFTNGFNKGDILFIIKAKPEKLKQGDVIIFNIGSSTPIIHRIINITRENSEYTFSTLGDNNRGQLSAEKTISEEQLVGKAIFKIAPSAGWGKMLAVDLVRTLTGKNAAYIQDGFCEEN